MIMNSTKLVLGIFLSFCSAVAYSQVCTQAFKIVAIGSSTTAGKGATPIDSAWVNRYTVYVKGINVNYTVTNFGVSGYTTYKMQPDSYTPPANRPLQDFKRNITKALSLKPDAIIINFPSNDVVSGYTIQEQQANFIRVTDEAKKANVPVWVTTTQPRNNLTAQQVADQKTMRDWIKSYYKEKSIDFWTGMTSAKDSIAFIYSYGDGIHVNNTGHRIFFERVVAENIPDTLCLRVQNCLAPSGLNAGNVTISKATVRWNSNGALSYNVQYKPSSETNWQTINTAADSLVLSGLNCSTSYLYRVQSACSANNASPYSSQASFTTLTCPVNACGPLPSGISTMDVGTVAIAGSACYITSTDTYKLSGAGDDVIKYTDDFRYVYKAFTGDGSIDVKVVTQNNSDTANEAGVMFRESLATGARNIFVGLTSSTGAFIQSRGTTNAATSVKRIVGLKAPYYVRMTKSGSTYSAFTSADGVTWKLEKNIIMDGMGTNGATIYAGLAINSHKKNVLMTAEFTQWHINEATPLIASQRTLKAAVAMEEKSSALKVFPNPAGKSFFVDFSIPKPENISIAVIGVGDGRIYYTESLSNFSGNYHKDLGNLNLAGGSYIVALKSKAGNKSVFLLKQ